MILDSQFCSEGGGGRRCAGEFSWKAIAFSSSSVYTGECERRPRFSIHEEIDDRDQTVAHQ